MATESDLAAFVTQVTCPEDFDAFWGGALAELADIPLDASATHDPLRSTDAANVYQASYRSRDGLEIFAWYAVPAVGDGPFPAVLILPGYKSEPALRRDWAGKGVAALSVAVRGKLPSSARFNPGLSRPAHPRRGGSGHLLVQGGYLRLRARRRFPVVQAGD